MWIDEGIRHALCPNCSDLLDFVEWADLDGVAVFADYKKRWLSERDYVDEWGCVLAVMDGNYPIQVDFPIKSPEDLASYTPPDPCAPGRFDSLRRAVARFGGKKAIVFRVRDAFSIPRYLRGMENILMDIVLRPDLVCRLVDLSVEYYTAVARQAVGLGADVLFSTDDYADNHGSLMSLKHFKELFYPGIVKVVQTAKELGAYFIKHSDGNLWPILDMLVDAGIDCIDPLDPLGGMTIAKVKSKYGQRIAMKGGIEASGVLRSGTKEEVRQAVLECIAKGAPGGGYIISACPEIVYGVNPENYRTMLETVRDHGTYPIKIPYDATRSQPLQDHGVPHAEVCKDDPKT